MKFAGFMPNDFLNGKDICVSLWTQGCPHHCSGCHNQKSWDFNGGYEVPCDLIYRLFSAIQANDIQRNFSVLGGEPLCNENVDFVEYVISCIRQKFPNIKIFVWTGYTLEELKERNNESVNIILNKIDVLIDGRFEVDKRDVSLELKGSTNQRVLYKGKDF